MRIFNSAVPRPLSARLLALATVALLGSALSGCNTKNEAAHHVAVKPATTGDAVKPAAKPRAPAVRLSANVRANANHVPVDTPITLKARDGTLGSVVVRVRRGEARLPGRFNADHTRWTAKELLEPGTTYVAASRATDSDGRPVNRRITFHTEDLTLAEQTYANVTPLAKEVVGVGMPVIVRFDVPVTDRARFERHMQVTASPAATGSWSWISDTEVHWRPKTYWKPGTSVHVDLDLNGVNAGNGIYGQMDRSVNFTVGRSVVMRANLQSDEMKVLLDGRLARTIPITGGMPGLETRSGTKLIIEKFLSKRMDAATVGVSPSDPDYYNIPDVRYAQRVTFSGEFLHAAPWSEYAQGVQNVSHGCVGMSTANAGWLYSLTHRGDPVEVTGTSRGLEPGNGWTDWNTSFAQYRQGSAL
jgi:lipoprotein-anchoring transpeptidase ErfK/SrfK